jgi:transposase
MEIVFERCCGVNVHKKMVVACMIVPDATGHRTKQIRTFATTTEELLQLHDWAQAAGCTHIAMESTGVYCKPILSALRACPNNRQMW